MTRKNIFKISKKIISITLIVALLVNSNLDLFAQPLAKYVQKNPTEITTDLDESRKTMALGLLDQVQKDIKNWKENEYPNTANGQIEEMCKNLLLCVAMEGKEKEWFDPAINLLYLNEESLLKEIKNELGKDAVLNAVSGAETAVFFLHTQGGMFFVAKNKDLIYN